jgi:diadenylate cyclase
LQEQAKREEFIANVMRMIAPGTSLREGIENILRAKTGALIVIGDSPEVEQICDGGFSIDCEFSPASLYELAKMDGAIILSEDAKKILYANTQLVPDSSIPSIETGIRHRTAERSAKQTGKIVIAISQRRNVITVYKGNFRYTLQDISVILTKANQALQTLEKYKSVLDQSLTNLSALEFEELVTLQEVALVMQRIEMVLRIKAEILKYINELGTEGRLILMQLEELVNNIEEEVYMLTKDYLREGEIKKPEEILSALKSLSSEELLDHHQIVRLLGYPVGNNILEEPVLPRGYRILNKIPRLPFAIVQNIVNHFHSLNKVVSATIEELDEVDGIGEIRARAIKEGLKRIQQQVFIDRHI